MVGVARPGRAWLRGQLREANALGRAGIPRSVLLGLWGGQAGRLCSWVIGRLRCGLGLRGAGFDLFSWLFSGEFQGGDQLLGEAAA